MLIFLKYWFIDVIMPLCRRCEIMYDKQEVCCFIGHRRVGEKETLKLRIYSVTEKLINSGMRVFLFGDHSEFNDMCYEAVTELKSLYPQIVRVLYRKDYPKADAYTLRFYLDEFDDCICPDEVGYAGVAAYVERNRAMIVQSSVCVFYYDTDYRAISRRYVKNRIITCETKSGTKLAYDFAVSQNLKIINLFENDIKEQSVFLSSAAHGVTKKLLKKS